MLTFLSSPMAAQIAAQLANHIQALPEKVRNTRDDLQQELKPLLSSLLGKLDWVTREEFDIQTKVLQQTRLRIEALEKQIQSRDNMTS